MKILFDHGTPAALRRHLEEHTVDRSAEKGWELLGNGELIRRAEEDGYQVIVTTDQSMRHQQNLVGRRLGIVVLMATAWPRVKHRIEEISAAIGDVQAGRSWKSLYRDRCQMGDFGSEQSRFRVACFLRSLVFVVFSLRPSERAG